ncbi:MAG: tetratricopeptide repeat protein [bacterium]
MSNQPGRNDPCPCGSGNKYKFCCQGKESPDYETSGGNIVPRNLDQIIQRGYELKQDNELKETADLWLEAWQRVTQFVEPGDRKIRDLDDRYDLTQSLFNWCQDLEQCLLNAGRNHEQYNRRLVDYADEFCELLPGTGESVFVDRKRAAAEACFRLGQVEEGERRFEQLLEQYPESPWVYINWGDMYSLFRPHEEVPNDPDRSRELYEQARPLLEDYEQKAVENRMNDLKEQNGDPKGSMNTRRRNSTMELELSEEQFETLMTLVEAGSWLINCHRKQSERIDRFDEVVSLIFSYAEESGLEDYVYYEENEDRYLPADELTQRIMDFVNEYENDSFWDNLVSRLAERDIQQQYDQETLDDMNTREWVKTLHEYKEKYWEEFEKHGIERLVIDKSKESKSNPDES